MREFISRLVSLVLGKSNQADVKQAVALVAQYRANNGGSNRTNWMMVTDMLTCVLACIRTGKAIEITDLYTGNWLPQVSSGKSPAYNLAHRQLSAGVIRPLWHRVQVVALVRCQSDGKGTVTGTPSSTARFGASSTPEVRLFIVPVAK